jgi:transposase
MVQQEKRYHSKRTLAKRYDVSTRSIDRWITRGRFPRPDLRLPNGRPLWADETVQAHERSLIGHTAAA